MRQTVPVGHGARAPVRFWWAAVRLSLALFVVLGLSVFTAPGAGAHALRQSSDPIAGATLQASPTQIVITFSERPDLRSSQMQVTDSSGRKVAGGSPQPVAGQQSTVVRIPVTAALPKGVYTVDWKTVSAVDGHVATGDFSFGVRVTPTGAQAGAGVAKSARPTAGASISRFVYLYGLIGLLGLVFTELVVLGPIPAPPAARRRLRRALAWSWVLGVVGAVGIALADRATAGLGLGTLLSSSIGHALVTRLVPLAVVGTALAASRRGRAGRAGVATVGAGAVGAAAALAMAADVSRTHAAATPAWIWYRVGIQVVHLAAAGIWIGGLAGLLLCLGALEPDQRGPAARRFSFWAGVALGAVLVTGTLRAVDEVGSLHGLFTSGFGQLIVVKSALFVLLVGLGGVNRFRNATGSGDRWRSLLHVGGAELVVMALVLAATAVLQNLTPPRNAGTNADTTAATIAQSSLPPLVVNTSDDAQTYRLQLRISPGTAGVNDFGVTISDYATRRPLAVTSVQLQFHAPNNPAGADSTLTLDAQATGTYAGRGANLSVLGQWVVTVVVRDASRTIPVQLMVVTQVPPQPTKVESFRGSPTIYTVLLAGGIRYQFYVDPIAQGSSQLHITFLDPGGQEVPLLETLSIQAVRLPDGALPPLFPSVQLTGGHFGGSGPGTPGTYAMTVLATTTDGSSLGATLIVPIK